MVKEPLQPTTEDIAVPRYIILVGDKIFNSKDAGFKGASLLLGDHENLDESAAWRSGEFGKIWSWLGRASDLQDVLVYIDVNKTLSFERKENFKDIKKVLSDISRILKKGLLPEFIGIHTPDVAPDRPQTALPETARLNLLKNAASASVESSEIVFDKLIHDKTIEILGGEASIGRVIRTNEELVQALAVGLPAEVLKALQSAGLPHKVLEQVIAPRRTLMRRRAPGQRLTRSESDAAWRLAHALALAEHVLSGRNAAISWLTREKSAFSDLTPIDLLETSVGSAQVEELLKRLEWGYVA